MFTFQPQFSFLLPPNILLISHLKRYNLSYAYLFDNLWCLRKVLSSCCRVIKFKCVYMYKEKRNFSLLVGFHIAFFQMTLVLIFRPHTPTATCHPVSHLI